MKNKFVKQSYHPSLINEQLEKISLLNRIDLITEKDTRQKSDRIHLVITYTSFYQILPKPLGKIGMCYR